MFWFNQRFPFQSFLSKYFTQYYLPSNLNAWYVFGFLALATLLIQIISGLWLAMFYIPTVEQAFSSLEWFTREVHFGWLFRYVHSTGASAFFIIIYCHTVRSLWYGSYKKPRELVWLSGMLLYLLLLMEAFMGYVLPWGQMSYWGAQIVTSLFDSIPFIGADLTTWIRGDNTVSGVTLSRFFALHCIGIPLILIFFSWFHITALHHVGSNHPGGSDVPPGRLPFFPFYFSNDVLALVAFLFLFGIAVFFSPQFFLDANNFQPANPLSTPQEIKPLWYMAPFYTLLYAIPNKTLGILAVLITFFGFTALPWLDRHPVRVLRDRNRFAQFNLMILPVSFLSLMCLGIVTITPIKQKLAQVSAGLYLIALCTLPLTTRYG
jgi:ubiquinol-cytochrome c reductase cytochrome b subunit